MFIALLFIIDINTINHGKKGEHNNFFTFMEEESFFIMGTCRLSKIIQNW